MTGRDYALWAEAPLTHDGQLAATLPVLPAAPSGRPETSRRPRPATAERPPIMETPTRFESMTRELMRDIDNYLAELDELNAAGTPS